MGLFNFTVLNNTAWKASLLSPHHASSEGEAVVSKVLHEEGVQLGLAAPVLVEGRGTAAEEVLGLLAAVGAQVVQQSGHHVVVVGPGAECGHHHGADTLVNGSSDAPDGENDAAEVEREQAVTLARVLDLDRVQMHVELRGKVRVQDTVDVLEMGTSGVLVEGVGHGVGPVEVAATGGAERSRAFGEGAP